MTDETIVAVYDTAAHADAAIRDLKAANIPADSISQHPGASTTGATSTSTATPVREQGFWSSLFGGEPDHDTSVYDRSVESGSAVVTVKVPEQQVTRVADILERHNPIDLDERATSYGLTQTTTTARTPTAPVAPPRTGAVGTTETTDGGTIRLAEESLTVGKRAVNRGTTRIRRYVVETPVQEQVTLRDETVKVERRPVAEARPVSSADFTEKLVEMTETGEEAVVSKTARVKEEVVIREEATERVETVKDTVRREEIEVEQVPGADRTAISPTKPTTPRAPKV